MDIGKKEREKCKIVLPERSWGGLARTSGWSRRKRRFPGGAGWKRLFVFVVIIVSLGVVCVIFRIFIVFYIFIGRFMLFPLLALFSRKPQPFTGSNRFKSPKEQLGFFCRWVPSTSLADGRTQKKKLNESQ